MVLGVIHQIVAFQAHVVGHHFGPYGGEVHADASVLHHILHFVAEDHEVVDVEVVAVEGIVGLVNSVVDQGATVVVLGGCIAAVDEMASHAVGVDATAVVASLVLVHGELLNLQHGVGQQGLIPLAGVHLA